ncbi:MAG: GIY-YIG nuclease family protein [Dehalococcoidia bacterium]
MDQFSGGRSTLYVGVTSDLEQRVHQHKTKVLPGFTSKHGLTKLVFAQPAPDALSAIQREKQIKSWRRDKKISLVEEHNPNWIDLAAIWLGEDGE